MKTFGELLDETVEVDCRCCGGSGGPRHAPCTNCEGAGTLTVNRYSLLTDAQRVTVLEAEVLRLQGLLADRYEVAKVPTTGPRDNEVPFEQRVLTCNFCCCREKRWKPLPFAGWSCDCCGAYWLQDETNRGNDCGSKRRTLRAVRR